MSFLPARLFLRSLLICLLVGPLVACNRGDGASGGGGPTQSQPSAPALGTLVVTIDNLPPGTAASVRISGPDGFARDLGDTQTVTGLLAGTYAITARPVTAGGQAWIPSAASQQVQVGTGDAARATVSYAVNNAALALARIATGLTEPVYLTAPAGDTRQFLVERAGRILVMQDGVLQAQPFLDIRARIDPIVDGLMSIAFDPGFADNGHFYVYRTDLNRDIVLERYTVPCHCNAADPDAVLTLLRIPHPDARIHYGGQVAFGPDGYLYVSTGDGGLPDDLQGNAQNLGSLLGKLLRLDVGAASAAEPYRIPPSNPYVGQPGRRAEIWASGLRNPWRFSFDRAPTGQGGAAGASLYIGDVGQVAVEEIDL
ncbi:MAG: glucose dehydrogenase, partial [Oxalobacteraceae bacterium]